MSINKIQKEYLENRMKSIIRKKLEKFSENKKMDYGTEDLFDWLNSGKVKMREKLEDRGSVGYEVERLFDFSIFKKPIEKNKKKFEAYKEKLTDKALSIMDKVILGDLGIEDAIASIEKDDENDGNN